jgi:hypothetical protein
MFLILRLGAALLQQLLQLWCNKTGNSAALVMNLSASGRDI